MAERRGRGLQIPLRGFESRHRVVQINYVTPTSRPVTGQWDAFVVDATTALSTALDCCRTLRRLQRDAPVLLALNADDLPLARADWPVDDIVLATAKDTEIYARVGRVLTGRTTAPGRCQVGELSLDRQERAFTDGRTSVPLHPQEFAIMQAFLSQPEAVLTREQLRAHAGGDRGGLTGRHIDVSICRLRRKLGEHGRRIETVRRVGYRFAGAARTSVVRAA